MRCGTVKSIWRYPVKGMGGEGLESGFLGKNGLNGDRIFAVRDTNRGEIQSCKFRPKLLLCQAKIKISNNSQTPSINIYFPDGSIKASDNPLINQKLTELLGKNSTLEILRDAKDKAFFRRQKIDDHTWLEELNATFEREDGEPGPNFSDLPDSFVENVCTPGSFFLVTPFHFVTTTSLRFLKSLNPGSDWNERRFRPNLVIECDPKFEGLLEKNWIGRQIKIGDATVSCVDETIRCGAITKAQKGLLQDKTMLRTIVKDANQNVGAYGTIFSDGHIRVGDPVSLL